MRFGYQIATIAEGDPIAAAQQAEELGFDIALLPDHVGDRPKSPMLTLAAIANATSTIRLGTYVLNNEMRNPVQLAWEAVTLDHLSNGRFELGIGAGHSPHEFTETGIEMLSARDRKARLADSIEILRGLLDGQTVTHTHGRYNIKAATVAATVQERLPIHVGGNGKSLLGHAGAHADIIGLQGLGKTLADGHQHTVMWTPEHLDTQLEQVQVGAGDRFGELEFNALVQVTKITDTETEAEAAVQELVADVDGLTVEHANVIPYILIGTLDQVIAKIEACHSRWGISYFAVRALDEFAPVLNHFAD